MGTINKVILLGNLGKDPEARSFENGGTVVNFPLATTESYYDREKAERVDLPTEWHNIKVTKPGLTTLAQKLQKGSQVYLEGSLRTRQYQTKEGETRYITEVHVNELVITGTKTQNLPSPNGAMANTSVEDNAAF
ncbi:MAG: single-stranded DNA-binding protein [Flavobacteriales bacterium]